MRFPPNRLVSLLVVAVAVSAATACGDAASEQATQPPAATQAPPSSEPSSAGTASVERDQTFTAQDGTQIPFALVLPAGFQPGDEHPILLALPPGSQGQEEVDAGLARYWKAEALERGWVVVSPVAPQGELYFEGSQRYLPELLDYVATVVRPEGGRFHLAGISNGGLSAFKVATENPELFRSLLALPGHPPDGESQEGLGRIAATRVWMLVGSEDEDWRESAEATGERLQELRADATVTILEGQGHILDVDPSSLYDFLDGGRPPDGG
jgi:predicted peptidase